jgi:putative OPT family oligopeptide transporter
MSQHEAVNAENKALNSESPSEAAAPVDLVAGEPNRGFTLRAVATGAVLGSMLSICNIYLGLKIGWGMNMSITAVLMAYGIWKGAAALRWSSRSMGIGENNISQTGASAAAAIASSGLVAPIPAWTLLTGDSLPYPLLVLWVGAVGLVGVLAGIALRRQLIEVDQLPFPGGIATGQTLKEMYAQGRDAAQRVRMLLGGIGVGIVSKTTNIVAKLHAIGLPVSIPAKGATAAAGVSSYSGLNLTIALEPSVLMVAVGALIGPRACFSMLAGGLLAWGVLFPWALDQGWATPGAQDAGWFTQGVKWLLWPGVAMMVTASLTSFAFSWRSVVAGLRSVAGAGAEEDPRDVPRKNYMMAFAAVLVASVAIQWALFDIPLWLATIGVLLSFLMAVVAGRVSGETNVTPVGAMGKVTQLTFGVLDPSNVSSNLMAANVTGGAASQCGDLLHDLKTGQMLGSWPRHQAVSQAVGVVAGAIVGSAAYMILIPDPKGMLLTDEWAAPAVATWKAVAEVFAQGIGAMPPGSVPAMGIAAAVGLVGAVLEKTLPKHIVKWMPSPVSVGLAFTLQVYTALAFAVGAVIAMVLERVAPDWQKRFLLVLAAGIIAGESLAGVADAFWKMLGG